MKLLAFIIAYPFIWTLSRLPLRLLYILSDFLFFIIYHIVGYRKTVVYGNLQLAFPEKSPKELRALRKKSMRHFADFIVESIKAFSLSEKEAMKRYKFVNPEVLNDVAKRKKNIILTGCHQNNWEWSVSMPLVSEIQIFGTYKEIKNKYFNDFMKKSRTKFGLKASKMQDTIPDMLKNLKNGISGAYILLSDQNPLFHKTYHWTPFFGVNVPVHTGAELLAKKFDMAIINYATKKVKRGYYETTFEVITETPKEFEDYKITDAYIALTEKNIRQQPSNYLWTHKRFKHKDGYQIWVERYKK
ncbi:lysophospholipid acyltransferase family protein [Tenacibaculum amylolyticum]|uniref:lysophospholipid acyltransferase family protein n=1 Tax=Tenacibaculum amylolyticum TaxID=104269 RepID=UPI0038963672